MSLYEMPCSDSGGRKAAISRMIFAGGGNNAEHVLQEARAIVQSRPDLIVAGPTNALLPLKKETDTIPIVFVQVSDPLGRGVVTDLARPTGNLTGFSKPRIFSNRKIPADFERNCTWHEPRCGDDPN